MNNWRASTWGDEISLEYGKAIRGYQEAVGAVPVYGTNGPVGWTDEPLYPAAGVILGRKGAYRGVHFSPIPFHVIDTAYYVVPKTDLDMRWLYYAIKYHGLGEIDDGSPIPSTTRAAVYVRDFNVPSKPEQLEMAGILSTLDDKIELNRRMNETLEAQARALFRDWFVDFGPVKAKMAQDIPYLPPDLWSLFPNRLDDDGVPEGWAMSSLDQIIEFNPREILTKGKDAPYLAMANLPTRGSRTDNPVRRPFASGSKFRNGDALLARITPCLENGKTAFVDCLAAGIVGWGSTEFIVMRSKPPVPRQVAYLIARDPEFRAAAIQSMSGTSGRQRASVDALAAYPAVIPHDEQVWAVLGSFLDPIFDKIAANAEECHSLSQARDLLLPKLMSGEIRVRESA